MITLLCDLDGVVYRGDTPLPGAAEALDRAKDAGHEVFFITNNSTRPRPGVVDKLRRIAGVETTEDRVITSAQAAVSMLAPSDGPVYVVGEEGIRHELARAQVAETGDAAEAGALIVGLTRALDYQMIADAARAVRNGARFIATNVDPTYPTNAGLLPGSGAIVAAIAAAGEASPEIAGKPHKPIRDLIRARGVDAAWVVGDRLDSDIALAEEERWTSVVVLTGVTTRDDPLDRADHVAEDLAEAVDLMLHGP